MAADALSLLESRIRACRICSGQFARTATGHAPKPVFWCSGSARVLIVGQAPGARVHDSGIFFSDASGARLRDWLGLSEKQFYDRDRIAILPMAFCFPGYSRNGSDLPPPPVCAGTWRQAVLKELPDVSTTLLIGGYAQKWHLKDSPPRVLDTVASWKSWAPDYIPLPHPSWRNNALFARIPGFETELLPYVKQRIQTLLSE